MKRERESLGEPCPITPDGELVFRPSRTLC
jgi:hypothetical protein